MMMMMIFNVHRHHWISTVSQAELTRDRRRLLILLRLLFHSLILESSNCEKDHSNTTATEKSFRA